MDAKSIQGVAYHVGPNTREHEHTSNGMGGHFQATRFHVYRSATPVVGSSFQGTAPEGGGLERPGILVGSRLFSCD
ncbi:hypothetical protein E4U53_004828 [Claviceps sorghi]|nr:hypothetical protein E4U53_004828 [Claviceps sorghi]